MPTVGTTSEMSNSPEPYLRGHHNLPHSALLHAEDPLLQPRDDRALSEHETGRRLVLVVRTALGPLGRFEHASVVTWCEVNMPTVSWCRCGSTSNWDIDSTSPHNIHVNNIKFPDYHVARRIFNRRFDHLAPMFRAYSPRSPHEHVWRRLPKDSELQPFLVETHFSRKRTALHRRTAFLTIRIRGLPVTISTARKMKTVYSCTQNAISYDLRFVAF